MKKYLYLVACSAMAFLLVSCSPLSRKQFQRWQNNHFALVESQAKNQAERDSAIAALPSVRSTANTVGSILEEPFRSFASSCGLAVYPGKSAIPSNVAAEFDLKDIVTQIEEQGVISLLSFFFEQGAIDEYLESGTSSIRSGRDYLRLDRFGYPLPVPEDADRVIHTQTCTGMVLAGLEAGFGFTGSVNATINADAQAEAAQELTLAYGKYRSPLQHLLEGRPDPSWSQWVQLQLWNLYINRPTLRNIKNPRYVVRFNGYSLFRGASTKSDYSIETDAGAGLNFGIASVDATLNASFQRRVQTDVQDYMVLIRNKKNDLTTPDLEFDSLPTFSSLGQMLEGLVITDVRDEQDDFYWLEARTYHQTARIQGMPTSMCNKERWSFVSGSLTHVQGSVADAVVVPAQYPYRPEGCDLIIQLVPESAFFSGSGQTQQISYELRFEADAAGAAASLTPKQRQLNFTIESHVDRERDLLVFSGITRPVLPDGPSPIAGSDKHKLTWNLILLLQERGQRRFENNTIVPQFMSTTCPTLQQAQVNDEVNIHLVGAKSEPGTDRVQFSVAATFPASVHLDVSKELVRECIMTFGVTFRPAGSSASISREVRIPVYEPLVRRPLEEVKPSSN